jgi:hypothetical protein
MKYAQHANKIASRVVDKDVILMRHQLAGAGNAPKPTQAGMIDQAAGFLCEQFIERQRGGWVVLRDIFANFFPVCARRASPNQPHELADHLAARRFAPSTRFSLYFFG